MRFWNTPKKIKKTLVVNRKYDNLSLPSALYALRGGKINKKTVDGRC
jgi:hypothetical protein